MKIKQHNHYRNLFLCMVKLLRIMIIPFRQFRLWWQINDVTEIKNASTELNVVLNLDNFKQVNDIYGDES